MKRFRLIAAGVAALGALATCATALAVVGGTPDNGRHPYAGAAVVQTPGGNELCSGFLVDSTTFITAAHCIIPGFPVLVSTAEGFTGPQSAGQGFVDPDYQVGSTGLSTSDRNDVAVVKLFAPLPGPYAQ